jgi:hypothetical protein
MITLRQNSLPWHKQQTGVEPIRVREAGAIWSIADWNTPQRVKTVARLIGTRMTPLTQINRLTDIYQSVTLFGKELDVKKN